MLYVILYRTALWCCLSYCKPRVWSWAQITVCVSCKFSLCFPSGSAMTQTRLKQLVKMNEYSHLNLCSCLTEMWGGCYIKGSVAVTFSFPSRCGHHQGPMSEGEMQLAQSVRVPELPATHVHQPQKTGARASHMTHAFWPSENTNK